MHWNAAASLLPAQPLAGSADVRIYAMGLQKAGTTVVGASLAAAMNVTFEPEAVSGCCGSRQLACYGAPSFLSGPDWLQSPRLFDGYDLSAYFLTCQDHLKARVMKADDMLPNAERLSAFVHLHSLAIRLVYISRHPFGNVASLRKWILQAHGELLPTFHNVSSLALLWRAATRRFLDARPGTFAAAVRYEDVMTSAMDTIQRAYSQAKPAWHTCPREHAEIPASGWMGGGGGICSLPPIAPGTNTCTLHRSPPTFSAGARAPDQTTRPGHSGGFRGRTQSGMACRYLIAGCKRLWCLNEHRGA